MGVRWDVGRGMALEIGEMTVLQAIEDGTGWRPAMDAAVSTSGVNVRSGPSATLPIVAVLKPNVRVVRLGVDEDGWAPVAVLGWVSGELLARAE